MTDDIDRISGAWPAMMRKAIAAAYLDLPIAAFERAVFAGALPDAVIIGGKERWSKAALDRAIGGGESVPDYLQEHRQRYG